MTVIEQARWILQVFEGGIFSEDPLDAGGATRWGITLRTLQYYRRKYGPDPHVIVTVRDVRALTLEEAVDCAVQVFAMESGIGCIADERLRFAALDYALHSGWVPAIRALQGIVGVPADGVWGPITSAAVERALLPTVVAAGVVVYRQRLMVDLVGRKPAQIKWLRGWMARTTRVLAVVTSVEAIL